MVLIKLDQTWKTCCRKSWKKYGLKKTWSYYRTASRHRLPFYRVYYLPLLFYRVYNLLTAYPQTAYLVHNQKLSGNTGTRKLWFLVHMYLRPTYNSGFYYYPFNVFLLWCSLLALKLSWIWKFSDGYRVESSYCGQLLIFKSH